MRKILEMPECSLQKRRREEVSFQVERSDPGSELYTEEQDELKRFP